MSALARPCAVCGEPLAYSGRGRPPVAHTGSCARTRANEVDEARREARYREALRDASVRAPLPGPEHVDADGDEETGPMQRLASAGYAPLFDDPHEGVPKFAQARTSHRREVLASLTRSPDVVAPVGAAGAAPACFGCPALAYVAGVVGVFTTETLSHAFSAARHYGEDRAIERRLDDTASLMARRPA